MMDSMKKVTNKKNRQKSHRSKEWPLVVYLWTIGLGFVGYLIGEYALSVKSHPFRWLLLLIGIILGILVGWFWYRWRRDIKL